MAEFRRFGGHVEADADDDRVASRFGQDASQLGVGRQEVVRPFEPGSDAGHLRDRRSDGHAGEQREPAPAGEWYRRFQQHREGQRGARRRGPGPAHPAAARVLLLGNQHRALRLPGQGSGQQVGVGGAGALDDLDVAPQAAGPEEGAAQGGPVQGRADLRMVLGSHANPLLFRKPGEGKSVTGLGTSQRRGADDDDAPSASASRGQQAGVAAPEREFRLWPPQVTFDAGPLAARARGVGASLTPAALLRNHRLFTIAACVSVIPRVIAALGFKPALLIQDSFSYMKQSVQLLPLSELRPAGYPLVLHLLQPFHSLLLVTTVQHLMGIALGAIIYAVLRTRGLPAWGATLAAVPTLFDSRQIWLESSILPDTLFTLALMIAVAILVVWPRPAIWQAVIVGLLVSWASVIRGNGAPVFVVILAFLLVMRVGWKVFVACLAAFVVPLAAYALIFFSEHGQLNITNSTGLFLWSRTMSFANCAVIKPPPSLVPLCPENQPGHPAGPAPAWSVPALLGERTPADYLWAP